MFSSERKAEQRARKSPGKGICRVRKSMLNHHGDFHCSGAFLLALLIRLEMHSKSELRKVMLTRRQSIPEAQRKGLEGSILDRIRTLPSYQKADSIALYMPIKGEVDMLPLWQPGKKRIFFPRVTGGDLIFSPASSSGDLVRGVYGIPEPISDVTVDIHEIDVVFVPGVVFDWNGNRLGYGKGYYDKLIRSNPGIVTIGVCFDEFCIEELPVDPWDARVELVITQTRLLKSKGEVT
jgi:5-formyltetrahydrofolate cyclo-ligase